MLATGLPWQVTKATTGYPDLHRRISRIRLAMLATGLPWQATKATTGYRDIPGRLLNGY